MAAIVKFYPDQRETATYIETLYPRNHIVFGEGKADIMKANFGYLITNSGEKVFELNEIAIVAASATTDSNSSDRNTEFSEKISTSLERVHSQTELSWRKGYQARNLSNLHLAISERLRSVILPVVSSIKFC